MKKNIIAVTMEWLEMTHKVLELKRIPPAEVQDVFKRTYEVLCYYSKDELIPKSVSKLLLEMDDFLYFASMITDNEFDDDPYLYQAICTVAESLKDGFFKSEYECEYPLLKLTNISEKSLVFDFENGRIEDLVPTKSLISI